MTQAIDAAVRAACEWGCTYPNCPKEAEWCDCPRIERKAISALRAALPAEPPAEVLAELVDEDCPWSENLVRYTWRALRAHLLGEDASL